MEQTLQQQAVALTEQLMRDYYCARDIYGVLDRMAPDVTWIGPGKREKIHSLEEIRAYFELGRESVPPCAISDVNLRAIDLDGNCCMVVGSMTIRTLPGSQLALEVEQRVSFTYRLMDGQLKVVHLHNSNPYGDMEPDEYFPHRAGAQSFQRLQRLLGEKTEVLDMIADNINGGLKGSNDDETFSYFYVNDGLPRMLGYTYDEFMKKSGGTAVGAAYPPDVPAAVEQCLRCFEKGPVYSVEYRMEKKDGSLIWVLDSGRKMVDSDGITRINSIVTDITPLKQALFDLEVERERYRIALEHIVGAMCEYDLKKDLFTVYQQTDSSGRQSVQQLEIPQFSLQIRQGIYSSTEDGMAFLDCCLGRRQGMLEFRTCFLHPTGMWYWAQFSCSIICDPTDGKPVRAIGILKDVTTEKNRNLELINQAQRDGLTRLLNQTAAEEAIQNYLVHSREPAAYHCALLIVDLDRFKDVNDCKGHLYGNGVLAQTARILESTAPGNSIIGRIGGDEFILLVKGVEPSTVEQMADEMVRQVRCIGTADGMAVSCSIGIAYRRHRSEHYKELFVRADHALYRAKDQGRDGLTLDV